MSPQYPKCYPQYSPPFRGGALKNLRILLPPISGGGATKILRLVLPPVIPPISGGSTKNLRNPPGYPKIFFALRAKKILFLLKTIDLPLKTSQNFRASREKMIENSNLPLKTTKFSSRFARKGAKNFDLPLKTHKIFFPLPVQKHIKLPLEIQKI